MGQGVSFPNLEVVLEWSAVGGVIITFLSQDTQQKFILGAILGFLSNLKGYEYANFQYPDWALPAGAFLTGVASLYPLPAILSIIVGATTIPIYLTYKSISATPSSQETASN